MAQKTKNRHSKTGIVRDTSKKILKILNNSVSGLCVKNIVRLSKLPRRTVYNNLQSLQKKGLVENVYPIWKVAQCLGTSQKMAQLLKSEDKIQVHNFSFVLRLIRKPKWWDKRKNRLIRLKEYHFKDLLLKNHTDQQLSKDVFHIQFFSNSIIFITSKKYYSNDSYSAFIEASEDFLAELEYIERQLNFKFYYDDAPQVNVRSSHYVHLKDELAKKCKKEGKMFEVFIKNKLRLWVDMSDPLGVEAGEPNYGVEDMNRYKSLIGDVINNPLPLPSDMVKMHYDLMKKVLEMGQAQISTHVQLQSFIESIKPPNINQEEEKKDQSLTSYFG